MPAIFDSNPDLKKLLLYFCRDNISTLSVESVHHFLLNTAFPSLAESISKESQKDYNVDLLISEYGLKSLHLTTVQRWMNKLGFKYKPRKKLTMLTVMIPKKM